MRKTHKKIISVILAVCLIAVSCPALLASAEGTSRASSYIYFGSYPDSSTMLSSEDPIIAELSKLSPGQQGIITYNGTRYQKNSYGVYFRCKPIKWRVLQENSDSYLLLSEYILDVHEYDDRIGSHSEIEWENSSMRDYLNSSFYQLAFTEQEQNDILVSQVNNGDSSEYSGTGPTTQDKVYLLSLSELTSSEYGFTDNDSRVAHYVSGLDHPNKYTKDPFGGTNEYDLSNLTGAYWTRTKGQLDFGQLQPVDIRPNGVTAMGGKHYCSWKLGIRPVIKLPKSSSNYSHQSSDLLPYEVRVNTEKDNYSKGETLYIAYGATYAEHFEIYVGGNPIVDSNGDIAYLRTQTVKVTMPTDDEIEIKVVAYTDAGTATATKILNAPKDEEGEGDGEQTDSPFTDVPTDAYYQDAVKWAVENTITSGTSATKFSPNIACTRAQAVTFLWRAAGSPKVSGGTGFSDVAGDAYYADAVKWAVQNGITQGTGGGKFSPNATCNRAQIVTFLYRAENSPTVSGSTGFSDVASNAYYNSAVKWAVDNGITSGTSSTKFSPNNNCTRAQIVTFLYRAS